MSRMKPDEMIPITGPTSSAQTNSVMVKWYEGMST